MGRRVSVGLPHLERLLRGAVEAHKGGHADETYMALLMEGGNREERGRGRTYDILVQRFDKQKQIITWGVAFVLHVFSGARGEMRCCILWWETLKSGWG